MSLFRKFADWMMSGEIPNCPSCNGSGEARGITDYVYWKGEVHAVCFQCKGSGKV
jgi:DnaJ-class molecular chaperone